MFAALCAGAAVALPFLGRAIPKSKKEFVEVLSRTGVRLLPKEEQGILGKKLVRAGLKMSPAEFTGLRVFLCAAFCLAIFPFLLAGADFFWFILFLPLVWMAPAVWLNSKVAARRSAVRLLLPDFSVFLSTALAAGADLPTALSEAGSNVGGPLAEEVERALREYRLNRDIGAALMEMADRCDVDELYALSKVVVQAYRYGSPVAEAVRAHADRMRTLRRFEVMEAAGKLTVMLVFPILFFMLVPTMVVLMYPAAAALIRAFVRGG